MVDFRYQQRIRLHIDHEPISNVAVYHAVYTGPHMACNLVPTQILQRHPVTGQFPFNSVVLEA